MSASYKQKEAEAMQAKRNNPDYRQREFMKKQNKNYGTSLAESIQIFHDKMKHGCIFVCSVCHQTQFEDLVVPVNTLRPSLHGDLLQECLTGYISENDTEFICLPCKRAIYKGKVPRLSIKNKCGFPNLPEELKLHPVSYTHLTLPTIYSV